MDGSYELDLDQKLLFDEPVHHQEGVRRIVLAFKQIREKLPAQPHEVLNVLAMDQVGRELHHVIEIGAEALQYVAKILEHLRELRVEIAFSYHATIRADG